MREGGKEKEQSEGKKKKRKEGLEEGRDTEKWRQKETKE